MLKYILYASLGICAILKMFYTASLFEKLTNRTAGTLPVRSRYAQGLVAVRSRHARGVVEARSRCSRGAIAMRTVHDRGTLVARSRYAHGTVEVRSRYARGALPVRSPVRFRFSAVLKLFIRRYYVCNLMTITRANYYYNFVFRQMSDQKFGLTLERVDRSYHTCSTIKG